jgi:hypothetical protein
LCIGARQVIEAWNGNAAVARDNLDRDISRIADVVARTELLVSQMGSHDFGDV